MPSRIPLTLGILTRNRPELLARALAAVAACADQPDHVIVSDDSDDSIRAQNRKTAVGAGFVTYLEGPRRGLGANENHIVRNAGRVGWIILHGDDTRVPLEFFSNTRNAIVHAGTNRIPSGYEIIRDEIVRPHRLNFWGYQSISYPRYETGQPLETVSVQSTPWPLEVISDLSWLEISRYGYDEVDMAFKFRRLGWQFVYDDGIWIFHDRSDVGRESQSYELTVARFYVSLRRYGFYYPQFGRFLLYAIGAPLQASGLFGGRGLGPKALLSAVRKAYGAFGRSVRADWRRC
jgi:GT2 family glycosyltransferase